ncbi:MAG: tail fiber domain-containing protein [Parabacteroides sp.]
MSKQYSYIERRIPATPRNKRLTDSIVAAASTGGGYIGGSGGTSYWQLVTTDEDGNALPEEQQYLVPVGAYPVVSLSDVVAYATTNPVANTPVTGYDTFGLVKIASGCGLIVTDGVLSIGPSAVGGLDEEALALYLTSNKYVREGDLATKGYLMLTSPLTGYVIADEYTAISPTDTVLTAIGKLERRFDGYVDLTTDQTIGGVKTFTETIYGGKDIVCYAKDSAVANTPVASTTTFGLVKIGDNLTVVDGVISAVAQQSGVQFTPGTALELTANSVLNVKFGTTGTTACAGNDSRLSDTRVCPYSLTWSGYGSGSYNGAASKSLYIPYCTSDLTNDSGYIKDGNGNFTTLSGSGDSSKYLAGNGHFYTIAASEISFPYGYVTLSTSQTITAQKTFKAGMITGDTSGVYLQFSTGNGIVGYKAGSVSYIYLNYQSTLDYTRVTNTNTVETTGDVIAYATSSAVANTPVASTSVFGLVKIGSGISVSGGVISVSGTSGSGGTTVSWGSGNSNYYGLNVGGTSKNVSLYGHTHSDYALSSHSHSLSRSTSGSGNVVTNVTVSGLTVTVTYGSVSSSGSSTASEFASTVKANSCVITSGSRNSGTGLCLPGGNSLEGWRNGGYGPLYLNYYSSYDVYVHSTAISSDMRLKNLVRYASGVLDLLRLLTPIYYTLKADPIQQVRIGLSAQQVQAVIPEAVRVADDGYLCLDYTAIHTLFAIGGLKELYALHLRLANEVRSGAHWRLTKDEQIRQLQLECAELRARIDELEKGGAA